MFLSFAFLQVDGIAALAGGASGDLVKRLADLELENKNLKQGK